MNSMLKKLKFKKEKKESEARQRLKKELFAYSRGINFGFLNKPSCMDYDNLLSLIAVGSFSGALHVYGMPGVELYGQQNSGIQQVIFLQGQARLVTLCEDNTVTIWQIDVDVSVTKLYIVQFFKCDMEEMCMCQVSSEYMLLYQLKSNFLLQIDFTHPFNQQVFSFNNPLQRVAEAVLLGEVVVFLKQPMQEHNFLIGYTSGVLVLWDHADKKILKKFNSNLPLMSASFCSDGKEFASCHEDGSYVVWSVEASNKPKEPSTCPYGPFPCKSMHAIKWHPTNKRDTFVFFTGGMPKTGYYDDNTLTVINYTFNHVVYQLWSRVVDFIVVDHRSEVERDEEEEEDCDNKANNSDVFALLILSEEELVCVDLLSCDWLEMELPYLTCIHSSPVLACHYLGDLDERITELLYEEMCNIKNKCKYSTREWPIKGGRSISKHRVSANLMLLGHEDGSLTLCTWMENSVKVVHRIHTSTYFTNTNNHPGCNGDGDGGDVKKGLSKQESKEEDESDWPPLRKIGSFHPCTEDPHLSIKQVYICNKGHLLVACNASGQVMLLDFYSMALKKRFHPVFEISKVNLKLSQSSSSYTGPSLCSTTIRTTSPTGYRLKVLIQLAPPSATTSISYLQNYNLLALGNAYGYAVYDVNNSAPIMIKDSLVSQASYKMTLKARTLQRSFRESFRKLKRNPYRRNKNHVGNESASHTSHSRSPEISSTSQLTQHNRPTSSVAPPTVDNNNNHRRSRSNPEITNNITYNPNQTYNIINDTNAQLQSQANIIMSTASQQLTIPSPTTPQQRTTPSTPHHHQNKRNTTKVFSTATFKHLTTSRKMVTLLKKASSRQSAHDSVVEVRCMHFARTQLVPGHKPELTLWVGTNTGSVFIHRLEVPTVCRGTVETQDNGVDEESERSREDGREESVEQREDYSGVQYNEDEYQLPFDSHLAKEITFKHNCPIIFISVLDKTMKPLSPQYSLNDDDVADDDANYVIVVTQKQFKLFSLPLLKAAAKYNITDDSCRLYKACVSSFCSKSDKNYTENSIVCLSNKQQAMIFSLPHLTLQTTANNLPSSPRMASCEVVTDHGVVLTFPSPGQITRHSFSPLHPLQHLFTISACAPRPPIEDPHSKRPDDVNDIVSSAYDIVYDDQKVSSADTMSKSVPTQSNASDEFLIRSNLNVSSANPTRGVNTTSTRTSHGSTYADYRNRVLANFQDTSQNRQTTNLPPHNFTFNRNNVDRSNRDSSDINDKKYSNNVCDTNCDNIHSNARHGRSGDDDDDLKKPKDDCEKTVEAIQVASTTIHDATNTTSTINNTLTTALVRNNMTTPTNNNVTTLNNTLLNNTTTTTSLSNSANFVNPVYPQHFSNRSLSSNPPSGARPLHSRLLGDERNIVDVSRDSSRPIRSEVDGEEGASADAV